MMRIRVKGYGNVNNYYRRRPLRIRKITQEYLRTHPDEVFVFGDNELRYGRGGAASFRYEKNTYGFITKKVPGRNPEDSYTVEEYRPIFYKELEKLKTEIIQHPEKKYLISPIGSGLANRYGIFEEIIKPIIKEELHEFENVEFLWS